MNQDEEFTSLSCSTADNGVAHLRFTQPDKANAMSREFWTEFPQALKQLGESTNTRALVISGEGKHFCSGMDLSIFSSSESLKNSTARERDRLRRVVIDLQNVFVGLDRLRFPTIAAIQGACIGGGLDLVSACDMRYVSANAYFCVQEINLAMMADMGVLQRLPNLLPDCVVRELAFTGDKLGAERALKLGFVNAVFETEEELLASAMSVAEKIAAKSPLAISASKDSINFARDNSLDSALTNSALMQSSILDIADLCNAAQAAARKSDANFLPLLSSTIL